MAKQNIFEYFGVGRRALPLLSSNKGYTGGRAKANGKYLKVEWNNCWSDMLTLKSFYLY